MEDVTQFLNRYYETFSTLDVESIAPFFNEPCIFISAQGVMTAANQDAVKQVFGTIAEALRAKGYGKSDLTKLEMKKMSDTITLASGVAVRSKVGGEELERVGVTYILQNSEDTWRIAVTVIHDAG